MEKKGSFFVGGDKQNRAIPWGERSQLGRDQGERKGGLVLHGCIRPSLWASNGPQLGRAVPSNLSYTSDEVLNRSATGVSLFCPGSGRWNTGSFHAGLRLDFGHDWRLYPQHVKPSKEGVLSVKPRDHRACQKHSEPKALPEGTRTKKIH